MKHIHYALLFFFLTIQVPVYSQKVARAYFPNSSVWEQRTAQVSGFDTAKLNAAIRFAKEKEAKAPRSMELAQAMTFGKEPFGEGIGPFADRGEPTGLIIRHGYIVASWGTPANVEMTHSVTKSFLSAVVGLAVNKGLIRNVQDTVAPYIPPIEIFGSPASRAAEELGKPMLIHPFATEHNRTITWDALLRQTSDWEGTLWGKPDWADRPDANSSNWLTRKRWEQGTVYEYNDVRVNALALAATSVWRKPLPEVLKEHIMDPIGASATWRWYGYRNSWIVLDGAPVQSVSGGGHWGGGMFINAFDMARFGLLTLHNGSWNGKQLLPKEWMAQATTPTKAQPTYGYMNFFLNSEKKYLPSAPSTSFLHVGNGTNIIFVDPDHDLVMVVRWIENNEVDGMVKRVLDAMKD